MEEELIQVFGLGGGRYYFPASPSNSAAQRRAAELVAFVEEVEGIRSLRVPSALKEARRLLEEADLL